MKKIPFKQKIFSCMIYIISILMLFFPWISIQDKYYNVFQLVIELKKTGMEVLGENVELFDANMSTLNVGIWVECGLFLLLGIFSVFYIISILRNKRNIYNAITMIISVVLCMWNTSGNTIPSLNDGNILMWCFPVFFMVLCTIEFFFGKLMEEWKEAKQKQEFLRAEDKAKKKEEKERLAFVGKYSSLFYRVVWKNAQKTWRDYALLLFCSSMVFCFILVGFGMRTLLKKENNIEGVVQAIGSLSSILLNAIFPLAIVSVIIIIIVSFYYLKCRAKNYSIFLTLGMRKRTLYYFIALEFVSIVVLTVLLGGACGTLILRIFINRAEQFLGVQIKLTALGVFPYLQSTLALLLLYLIAFMSARDIFVSFNLGNSADLQGIKEKIPMQKRKLFLGMGIVLMLYSMMEYQQLRNFENATLLLILFMGLCLVLRYGIVEYLLWEKRKEDYLSKLLIHNQLFHKSKTNTAYITAMSILLFGALFCFPLQFISVLIAEDENVLYPYDFVCMANQEDYDIFEKIQKKYEVTLDIYPMVRVANIDSTQRRESVHEAAPLQGQQIGISESTYRALKEKIDDSWEYTPLLLDNEGESVYIVHQQDKSIKAQPVDYWLSRKKPVLHVGVPNDGVDLYNIKKKDTGYYFKEIKGEEIGSLIGTFGQGKWDNLIVFSDEYFEDAKELWKTTNPFNGSPMTKEQMNEFGFTEKDLVQGPCDLVLIKANEKDSVNIEKDLKEFKERHKADESYNMSVQSCYIKKNAVQKLRTERIMKNVMNVMLFVLFIIIYYVLLIVKILMEREMTLKRSKFLMCMGMRKKERKKLIWRELFQYFYLFPITIAIIGTGIFTVFVFHVRQYQLVNMKEYLNYAMPLWGGCLVVIGITVNVIFIGYAHKVEEQDEQREK